MEDKKKESSQVKVPEGKAEFKAMMAAYKEQNPKKYKMKEEAFEAKLKTM